MFQVVNGYKRMKTAKLQKAVALRLQSSGDRLYAADQLLELRERSSSMRLEACERLCSLETLFDEIAGLTAKIGGTKF